MWLDELPVEVCERICRNMLIEWDPSSEIYHSILALSRVSDKQKTAAVRVAPTHFSFSANIHKIVEGFDELVAPKLQSLSLARPVCPEDEPLFRAPHLRSVAMEASSEELNVLAGCSSLRQLHLLPEESVPWEEVLGCLQTLRLTQLVLEYRADSYHSNCPCVPLESSSTSNERLEALLSALPELQFLAIRCWDHIPHDADRVIQRILQLPNINQVHVISSVPPAPTERLKKLHNVIIDHATVDQFQTALALSSVLTHFFATKIPLDGEQLAQLKNCKRLKAMSVALEQGAEAGLGELVHVLPNLRSLEVEWPSEVIDDDEGCRKRTSYAAFPGAIRRAAEAGKKLIELKICNATVDAFELEQILKTLGKRLLTFTLTISYPDLEGFACLQRCLDGILKYNPSLNKLGIKWQGYVIVQPFHATRKQKGPILRLLRTTRRLYVQNMLPRLPYFLMALNGYYTLAFLSYPGYADSSSESDGMEEEGAENDDEIMQE